MTKSSLERSTGFPRTLSTTLKTSRTLAISGKHSWATLQSKGSDSPWALEKRAIKLRSGSRNSPS
eukprot:9670604-Alexandrium_andersonii.AAC.1